MFDILFPLLQIFFDRLGILLKGASQGIENMRIPFELCNLNRLK
jgi:hypothetical protein